MSEGGCCIFANKFYYFGVGGEHAGIQEIAIGGRTAVGGVVEDSA